VERAEAVKAAEATLHEAGFKVSQRCTSRPSCFDFAARKEDITVFLKVSPDIRDIGPNDAWGLKTISECLSCSLLFISDINDEKPLRDDTVYSRYGIYTITTKTLEDIVRGSLPLIEATPGGYYVRIDGNKLRERRHELGLSIGKIAEMAGISRSSLYSYEREITRASVSAAYRLEQILGVPLVKTINIFKPDPPKTETRRLFNNFMKARNRLLHSVIKKLSQFNLKVSIVNRAPFDFAAFCPETRLKIIGGLFKRQDKRSKMRIEEIISLSSIIDAKPFLLSDRRIAISHNISFIDHNEITKTSSLEELTSLL